MRTMLIALLFSASTAAAAPLDALPQTRLDADLRCLLGSYALASGEQVIINGDAGQSRNLSYTLSSGQFGSLREQATRSYSDGRSQFEFAPCSTGTLKITRGAISSEAVRTQLVEKQTSFASDGITLHGKLVLPAKVKPSYAAVWVEGSNNDPSTDDSVWQYALASRGIATFVYDKRGTGASGGAPSSDFHARARDTAAAVEQVRRLAPGVKRIGVIGGSQGGWVAPLVATLVRLDFVIPAFAMAEGPIAQDRELVAQQLRDAGFDDRAQAQASELTEITARIVRFGRDEDFAALDAFKARYANAAWMKAVAPRSYTGLFLQFPAEVIKANGPAMAQGLSFDHDPRPVIEAIKPRQLWLLGGSDRQAPNAATQAILKQIQASKANLSVVVFPRADHGLIETISTADGDAKAYSPGLFDITADWIRSGKLPAAGRFIVMPATH